MPFLPRYCRIAASSRVVLLLFFSLPLQFTATAFAEKIIPRVGGPAQAPGQGYDTRAGQWRSRCVTGDPVYAGSPAAAINLENQVSRERLTSYMSSSLSGKANLFVVSAKATVSYSRSVSEDRHSMTLTFMRDIRGKKLTLENLRLSEEGIRARDSRDPAFIRLNCGEQFARQVSIGGTLFLNVHYEFANKEIMDEFKAVLRFRVLGFKVTKSWKHSSRFLNRNTLVRFDAWQTGGQPDKLQQLLEQARQRSCTLDKLADCEEIVESLFNYATAPEGFESQLNNLEWNEDGQYPALSYSLSRYAEAGFPELEVAASEPLPGITDSILESIATDYAVNRTDYERAKSLLDSGRLISPELEKIRGILGITRKNTVSLLALRDICMKTPSACQQAWQREQLRAYNRHDLSIQEKLYHYCIDTDPDNHESEFRELFRQIFSSHSYRDCEDLNNSPGEIRRLNLSNSGMGTVAPLKFFSGLTDLDISHNDIVSLRPLSNLKNLRIINFRNNQVTDLRPLKHLNRLHTVNASYNAIRLSGPLQREGPERLYLHGNFLTDAGWFAENRDKFQELILTEEEICRRERLKALESGSIDRELYEIYKEAGFAPDYKNPASWLFCPVVARNYPH